MSGIADRLYADRLNRDAARVVAEANLARVKADLAARGIGGRIVDKASNEAKVAADQTLAIARESKGIIALTAAALGLWLFRKPLLRAAGSLIARAQSPVNEEPGSVPETDWSSESE